MVAAAPGDPPVSIGRGTAWPHAAALVVVVVVVVAVGSLALNVRAGGDVRHEAVVVLLLLVLGAAGRGQAGVPTGAAHHARRLVAGEALDGRCLGRRRGRQWGLAADRASHHHVPSGSSRVHVTRGGGSSQSRSSSSSELVVRVGNHGARRGRSDGRCRVGDQRHELGAGRFALELGLDVLEGRLEGVEAGHRPPPGLVDSRVERREVLPELGLFSLVGLFDLVEDNGLERRGLGGNEAAYFSLERLVAARLQRIERRVRPRL